MASYAQQWQSYRRRHWAAVLGLVIGFPASFAVVWLCWQCLHSPLVGTMFVVVSLWAIGWGWLAFRVTRFPCPRCGTAFNSGYACSQCSLLLYEQA
jgi:hypothetical protein